MLHLLYYLFYPNTIPKYIYNVTGIHAMYYHIKLNGVNTIGE